MQNMSTSVKQGRRGEHGIHSGVSVLFDISARCRQYEASQQRHRRQMSHQPHPNGKGGLSRCHSIFKSRHRQRPRAVDGPMECSRFALIHLDSSAKLPDNGAGARSAASADKQPEISPRRLSDLLPPPDTDLCSRLHRPASATMAVHTSATSRMVVVHTRGTDLCAMAAKLLLSHHRPGRLRSLPSFLLSLLRHEA
ncbi:uncharacterized protein BKA78DRAFT_182496 [Phyllosticta capitalensis]|uniref:uncharacterized protein n=1 Tax=Phyllosticta capitalensis TaxID=121624 RepID=UPI00312D6B09